MRNTKNCAAVRGNREAADAIHFTYTADQSGSCAAQGRGHCAALAKKALLRPLDTPNADPYYAALEKELLDAINATGFGPQGFGGATTCLGVAIEQKPTHVACLPVAVNISCHVTRRASREV